MAILLIGTLGPWHTHDFQGDCVPANRVDQLGPRVYDNHRTITVSVGTVVTAQLGTGESADWPWETPRSSAESVLKPIPLCADPPNITTLPVLLTPFKAISPGQATIKADLVRNDTGFESFDLTVIVRS